MKIERGSEWRKWDLHLHTASSYDYKYQGDDSDVKIIEAVKSKNVSVIAITDHFVIDQKRIESLRNIDKDLTILPGVELRTDKGDTNIHVILLFGENIDLKTLCENFNVFKRNKGKSIDNNEKIYWDYNDIVDFANENNALISIHAGKKRNGIDDCISTYLPTNIAIKEEYYTTVDIYEMGKVEDFEEYETHVFVGDKKAKPMIICSDCHNPNEYNSNLWIKAEPNFNGLKQILYETESRICISETKPDEKLGYNVIDSIVLNDDKIWNQTIHFNPNLNTIIGGRSTGKSSLLKVLYKNIVGGNFSSSIEDEKTDVYLNTELIDNKTVVNWVTSGNDESKQEIVYFRQGYMHDLADTDKKDKLNTVIRKILKNTNNGEKILAFESTQQSNQTSIVSEIASLFALNNEISQDNSNIQETGSSTAIQTEISKIKNQVSEISGTEKNMEDIINKYTCLCEKINESQIKTNNVNNIKNILLELQKISTLISSTIINQINTINENEDMFEIKKDFELFENQINETFQKMLSMKIEQIDNYTLNENNERKKLLSTGEYRQGEELKKRSVVFDDLNKKISTETIKLNQVLILEKDRDAKLKQQIELLNHIISNYLEILQNGETLCETLNCKADELEIKANYSLNEARLRSFYEEKFNSRSQNNIGVDIFINEYKKKNKEDFIKKFLTKLLNNEYVLKGSNIAQTVASDFLGRCWYSIDYDIVYQKDKFTEMSPGKQAFVVLKLLLDFSTSKCPILIDQPEDSLDNRAIYTELVKYLKNKKRERQIILVTHNANIVVGADAEQVIVASQNGKDSPNSKGIKFQYLTGALENSKKREKSDTEIPILERQGIREHICEILEGGQDAFDIREKKYGFTK